MQIGPKKLLSLLSAFFLAWIVFRFLMPLFSPFFFGTLLALASEPFVKILHKRMRLPRSLSAGIGISLTFLLLCGLLLLLCAFALRELRNLAGELPEFLLTLRDAVTVLQHWLLSLSRHTPENLQPILQENLRSLFSSGTSLLEQTFRSLLGFAGNLLSHVPDSALTLGTAVLSAFMISARLPILRHTLLQKISRERLESLSRFWRRLRKMASLWFTAQAKLMGITFLLLFLGLVLLRIPHAFFWAAGISLVDAFPILGTGTVLLPWSLLLLTQGDTARAIGMAGIYTAISLIRSALEPKLLGSHLGLDPLAALFSMYAGFRLWGIGGMLLAPLLTVTALQIFPDKQV